jgi:hypothetical protein
MPIPATQDQVNLYRSADDSVSQRVLCSTRIINFRLGVLGDLGGALTRLNCHKNEGTVRLETQALPKVKFKDEFNQHEEKQGSEQPRPALQEYRSALLPRSRKKREQSG